MKTYKFTASTLIEAENEEKAKEEFTNNSFDFASTAKITEPETNNEQLIDKILKIIDDNSYEVKFDNEEAEMRIDGDMYDQMRQELIELIEKENK